MHGQPWYVAEFHQHYETSMPSMQGLINAEYQKRQRPSSPVRANVEKELLVLDTNILLDMVSDGNLPLIEKMYEILRSKLIIHLPFEVMHVELDRQNKQLESPNLNIREKARKANVTIKVCKENPKFRGFIHVADHRLKATIYTEIEREEGKPRPDGRIIAELKEQVAVVRLRPLLVLPLLYARADAIAALRVSQLQSFEGEKNKDDHFILYAAWRKKLEGKAVVFATSDKLAGQYAALSESRPLNIVDFSTLKRFVMNERGDNLANLPPSHWVRRREVEQDNNRPAADLPAGWRAHKSASQRMIYYSPLYPPGHEHERQAIPGKEIWILPTQPAVGWQTRRHMQF